LIKSFATLKNVEFDVGRIASDVKYFSTGRPNRIACISSHFPESQKVASKKKRREAAMRLPPDRKICSLGDRRCYFFFAGAFLAAGFFATTFLAGAAFFAGAAAFLTGAFATGFFATALGAAAFLTAAFATGLATGFFAGAAFFAGAFAATGFLATGAFLLTAIEYPPFHTAGAAKVN
jgi:hypothetical protein